MNTNLLLIGLFVLPGIFSPAQVTEEKKTEDFHSVRVYGSISVVISQGDSCRVKVICEEKDGPETVSLKVSDGVLGISGSGKKSHCKVHLVMKELRAIEASDAVYVRTEGEIKAGELIVNTGGAATVKLKVQCKRLDAVVGGASSLSASGNAGSLKAEISGASFLKAFQLKTGDATIILSGSSGASVFAEEKLTADLSGASTLKYIQDPKVKMINVTGVSMVKGVPAEISYKEKSDTTGKKILKHKVIVIEDHDVKIPDIDVKVPDKFDFEFPDDDHHWHSIWHGDDQGFHRWAGLELGVNGYTDNGYQVALPAAMSDMDLSYSRSVNVNLNIIEHDFHLWKNHLNLVTGLGLSWHGYAFRHPVTLDPDATYTYTYTDSTISDFRRNKLRLSSVTLPLLIEYNSSKKPHRAFHFAAGIIGEYVYRAKTIQEYTLNGDEISLNRRDDYNLNPFWYSAAVRAGYGDVTLYATWALSELFEKNRGPSLHPFSLGIRIIPF